MNQFEKEVKKHHFKRKILPWLIAFFVAFIPFLISLLFHEEWVRKAFIFIPMPFLFVGMMHTEDVKALRLLRTLFIVDLAWFITQIFR